MEAVDVVVAYSSIGVRNGSMHASKDTHNHCPEPTHTRTPRHLHTQHKRHTPETHTQHQGRGERSIWGCKVVCTRQKTRTSTIPPSNKPHVHLYTTHALTHTRPHTTHNFWANFFSRRLVSHGNAAGNPRRVGARHGVRAPALTALLCCDENGSSARLGLRETARRRGNERSRKARPMYLSHHHSSLPLCCLGARRVSPESGWHSLPRYPGNFPRLDTSSPPPPRQRKQPVGLVHCWEGWRRPPDSSPCSVPVTEQEGAGQGTGRAARLLFLVPVIHNIIDGGSNTRRDFYAYSESPDSASSILHLPCATETDADRSDLTQPLDYHL